MKKIVTVDPRAKKELGKFNEKVRFQIDSFRLAEKRLKDYEQN